MVWKLLAWICPRAFIPWWVPRRVFIPPEVPPRPSVIERVASPASLLRQPRQPRDLLDFAQPRRTRRLVSLTASPAYLPKQATSLAVSPTSQPLQRTDPRTRGLYPEIGAPSGLYPTSGAPCRSSLFFRTIWSFNLNLCLCFPPNNRFRMMVAAWSCVPSLQIIDSG